MAEIELIGVPFDGYGRPGNQARAASALRDAGLLDAFEHHHVVGNDDLDLPAGDPARGADQPDQRGALLAMTDALNERVGSAVTAGRLPIVYGGDCSTLLGIVTGLRDHVGDVGLVFIDGHEDTMPLDVSEDGEAANTELGLLLGLTGRTLGGDSAIGCPRCAATGSSCWAPRRRMAQAVQCRHARRQRSVGGAAGRSRRRPRRRRAPCHRAVRRFRSTGGGCTSTSTCSTPSSSRRRACPTFPTSPVD